MRVTRAQWIRGTKKENIDYQDAKVTTVAFIDESKDTYTWNTKIRNFLTVFLYPIFHDFH